VTVICKGRFLTETASYVFRGQVVWRAALFQAQYHGVFSKLTDPVGAVLGETFED